jgi:peptidoglycan/LPS O-acetylase OafA/YrhL
LNGRSFFPKTIPQLDGVRGIAILLVLICHAEGFRLLHLGQWGQKLWFGVDLFFVLSGFLITGVLADSRNQPRFFRNFYGRRMLRLLPVYVIVIIGTYLLLRFGALYQDVHAFSWVPYALVTQNIVAGAGFHALGPTWSLAIEEHFYLVWPWLVRRLDYGSLMRTLLLLFLLSPLARTVGFYLGAMGLPFEVSGLQLYKQTWFRLDGLAIGGLLALWMRMPSFTLARLRIVSWAALLLGAPLSIWLVPPDAILASPSVFTMSATSLMSAGFLGLALLASRRQGRLARFLAFRPLCFLGQISYCLYLVHVPVLDLLTEGPLTPWLASVSGAALPGVMATLLLLGCFGIPILSWYALEQPVLRLKRYYSGVETARPKLVKQYPGIMSYINSRPRFVQRVGTPLLSEPEPTEADLQHALQLLQAPAELVNTSQGGQGTA